ncbi:MAG: M6 family metalloprotease domain-containing protein [Chitinispirillaceae bacterium]|nr:M6 family metalloprotease domain-containing protein [Chitinispirillaceae bacterium]
MQKINSFFNALIICVLPLLVFGAPHNGNGFDLEQPDGSTVPVLVWGDEFYQHVESPDGFTLVRNEKTGWICYAQLSSDSSELLPTDSIYRFSSGLRKAQSDTQSVFSRHLKISREHRLRNHEKVRSRLQKKDESEEMETPAPAPPPDDEGGSAIIMPLQGVNPVKGEFTGLTILIDFSDKTATIPKDSVENFVNKRGYTGYGNNGSVRDYFYDVSGGKVDYKNIVLAYHRARNPKNYYDNSTTSFGLRAQELILEALNKLKNEGFDFSQLSSNSRKRIYAVNVLYAGTPSMGWSKGLWPHQGSLSNFSANGYSVTKYQISNIGTSLSIGTFCHENGHLLFNYPDLYDYGGESQGVGNYCIMCGTNSKNPARPCAYLRDYSGWDVVTDITDIVSGTILTALPNSNSSFTFRNRNNSSEMFYIEATRRNGRSKTLPDSGFMIWHVDRKGSNNNEKRTSSSHYLVSLEQADNLFELELNKNSGKKGDLFRMGYKNRFDDETKPSATWWNGSKSGMQIWNMSQCGDTMSFSIGDTANVIRYKVAVSASDHGSVNPSGVIQVRAGQSLQFIVKPDSGYQIDRITVNGATTSIKDTVKIENISSDQTMQVDFGIKSSIVCISPREEDLYYVGDTMVISWQKRGVTVEGIVLSYSVNNGEYFTTISGNVAAKDSVYKWKIPDLESNECIIKIADRDENPSTVSGLFSIRRKPQLSISEQGITIAVAKGKKITQDFQLQNSGTGNLTLSATMQQQIKRVLINELSIGADAKAPDAVELWNSGADIDISGWKLIWEDNKVTSGSFTFKDGTVFKGGEVIVVHDLEKDTSASSFYMGQNVQWLFSDFLEFYVTLTDREGRGVDFVKSPGSPSSPPDGTGWLGEGIELCTSFVARTTHIDTDSLLDWICSGKGTLKQLNTTQQKSAPLPFLTLLPVSKSVSKSSSTTFTVSIDATDLDVGILSDTVVIYHNDPSRPSPLKIPCQITVYNPSSVKKEAPLQVSGKQQASKNPELTAAPNPVFSDQSVTIKYTPVGNERYGDLFVFNSMGNCLFHERVNFFGISSINRKPAVFFWTPKNSGQRRETCLVRMNIINKDGSKTVQSMKVGLR